ncbi:MAG: hypothetical protein IBX69_06870 [Anaerolineales bacterium]|nr:hypothetical protein [Anaerolineales bacterium]
MSNQKNPWKGFLVGMLGGIFGLLAMRLYRQRIAPRVIQAAEQRKMLTGQSERRDEFNDISIFGPHYQEGESAAMVLGRKLFRLFSGREPRAKETRSLLETLVHLDYGMFNGGVYGSIQGKTRNLDLKGGLLYGFALWLYKDEAILPLLGLQPGPTASKPIDHLNRLGAHLFYGGATSVSTQVLFRLF